MPSLAVREWGLGLRGSRKGSGGGGPRTYRALGSESQGCNLRVAGVCFVLCRQMKVEGKLSGSGGDRIETLKSMRCWFLFRSTTQVSDACKSGSGRSSRRRRRRAPPPTHPKTLESRHNHCHTQMSQPQFVALLHIGLCI